MTAEAFSDEIAHPTLSERVYQRLRFSIEQRELAPGTRLVDAEIASKYNVSRTPVREAINRLAAEGLVTVVPRRGAFVVKLTPKEIADLYAVREALEVLALRTALPALTEADTDYIDQLIQQSHTVLAQKDYGRYFEIDRQFHDLFIEKSGNGRLAELYSQIGGSIQVTRWLHCDNEAHMWQSVKEHKQIVAALRQGEHDDAVELLRRHINKVMADLLPGDLPDG